MIGADGVEGDDAAVLADAGDGGGRRDGVADVGGCGELHRLREIEDLAVLKFVAEHGRDKGAAEHAVGDAAAKPRLCRKLFVLGL